MKARPLWLIVPWAVFIVAAVGWVIYWNVLANTAEQRVRAWAAEQTASGGSASIGRITRQGFPVLLRLEISDLAFAPARGGWRATTARTDLHVQVMNPQHIILEMKAPVAVTRNNGAVTNVSADALIASLRTDGGNLAVAGLEGDNVVLDDPAEDGVLHAEKVVLNLRPDPREADEYQLAFTAERITLPRPVRSFETFGQDVASLRAAIVIEGGAALLNAAPEDPLGPWRTAGGRLRFEGLALHWGPLQASGAGDGGLDEQRRITGRLELPLEQPAPVLTAIANGPNMSRDARRALAILAAGYAATGETITIDVNANDGWLRLEGLPVRPLPPVY